MMSKMHAHTEKRKAKYEIKKKYYHMCAAHIGVEKCT